MERQKVLQRRQAHSKHRVMYDSGECYERRLLSEDGVLVESTWTQESMQ